MSDAYSRLTELAGAFDFKYFLVGLIPQIGSKTLASDIYISNLPMHVYDDFIAMDLVAEFSAIQEMHRSTAPFVWQPDGNIYHNSIPPFGEPTIAGKPGEVDKLLSEELNITYGHCHSAATRGHRQGFQLFLSTSQQPTSINAELHLGSQRLFAEIETLASERGRETQVELYTRELECLTWAAAGKTSSEIGTIVGLSEHTVNHYLNACCKKLDCVNRTQAVAKAIRSRLIP